MWWPGEYAGAYGDGGGSAAEPLVDDGSENAPSAAEEERRGYYHDDDEPEIIGGRPVMSMRTRRFISACQWIPYFCLTIIAGLGLVDCTIDGNNPADEVYDDEDEAALHGVSNNPGYMTWWGYIIPQTIAAVSALVAATWEWRVYGGFAFVGMDLTWSRFLPGSKERAIRRGKEAFCPVGAAYEDYYYLIPMVQILCFALYVFHISYGQRLPNRFAPVWISFWVIYTPMIIAFMYNTYYLDFNIEKPGYVDGGVEIRLRTQHLNRQERERRRVEALEEQSIERHRANPDGTPAFTYVSTSSAM